MPALQFSPQPREALGQRTVRGPLAKMCMLLWGGIGNEIRRWWNELFSRGCGYLPHCVIIIVSRALIRWFLETLWREFLGLNVFLKSTESQTKITRQKDRENCGFGEADRNLPLWLVPKNHNYCQCSEERNLILNKTFVFFGTKKLKSAIPKSPYFS